MHTKMLNLDSIANANNKEYNKKWLFIPDHPYRILVIGGSGLEMTDALLNLISQQDDIDKIYLYAKDLIADIITNKKVQAIIKELFIRCRKLNISLVFITQFYFSVPKNVRLNLTHYLIMKNNDKTELQNIATNHSADIDDREFVRIYRECTK